MTSKESGTIKLLERLIAFDTTSHLSNLELISFIEAHLAGLGIQCELVHDEDKTKANLYATLGPAELPGVMLSGHTDVVPVKGQAWSSPPFELVCRDNKYFGRGSADMKTFIAAALSWAEAFAGAPLLQPIHLAFSYDEEIGCVGVRRLLDIMENMPVKPAMCIVGEPTGMQVITAHKGKLSRKVLVFGREAHSSLPQLGVNAIDYAAELILFLRELNEELAEDGPFEEGYEVTHSTIHTGLITGGTVLNTIPNLCEIDFEIRNIPSQDPQLILDRITSYVSQEIEPKMRAQYPECGISFEKLSGYPGMFTPPESEVIQFVQALTSVDGTSKISFGTEGGLFTERLGIPTVVCGPGQIAQAHKPDEYVDLDQVTQVDRFMGNLLKALC